MNLKKSLAIAGLGLALALPAFAKDIRLLNVSYDPTRELYTQYNQLFANYWKQKTGDNVIVSQSHGGAGKQARAIIDGLEADVATLAISYDVDQIAQRAHAIPNNWQSRLQWNSTPYHSTIVFLVRKGNPKHIRDWNDLIRGDVKVISPNPKTSGGARYNFLAAWAYALKHNGGNPQAARDFVTKLYRNVPVLDAGARGATTTFLQRRIGDVLITWENEAFLAQRELGRGSVEIVVPSFSVLAEPPVTVIDKYAAKHGTTQVATEYLKYLYSPEAQNLIARNYYRPSNSSILAQYSSQFPKLELFTVGQVFGNWNNAQKTFFDDGAIFDQIYRR